LFVLDLTAKSADVGEEAIIVGVAGEGVGQHLFGAAGGQHDGDITEPERLGPVPIAQQRAIHHPVGQGGEEFGVRGDGIERHGRSSRSASASAIGSPTWNHGASSTTPKSCSRSSAASNRSLMEKAPSGVSAKRALPSRATPA